MNKDYIELNAFLKKIGVAGTGGQAKLLIRNGEVLVNGEIETRNKKKLYPGDKVEYSGKEYKYCESGRNPKERQEDY